jgi:hypothetical protein
MPPPRSLTAAVTAEVERLNQVCDTLEVHLVCFRIPEAFNVSAYDSMQQTAIAVLQRDIEREEQSNKAKEEAVASRTRSKTPSSSPVSSRIPLPPLPGPSPSTGAGKLPLSSPDGMTISPALPGSSSGGQSSPPLSTGSSAPSRRASVISLSSLQRPFPHKLDLSATTLRIGPDEIVPGLASPVTLAPRSARPIAAPDFPPDLYTMSMLDAAGPSDPQATASLAAGGGSTLDLTMSDDLGATGAPASQLGSLPAANLDDSMIDLTLMESPKTMPQALQPGLGTADKPIELDLDMDGMEIDMPNLPGIFSQGATGAGQTAGSSAGAPLPSVLTATETGKVKSAMELLQELSGAAPSAPSGVDTIAGPGIEFTFGQTLGGLGALPLGNEPSPASMLASMQPNAGVATWDLGLDLSQLPPFENTGADEGGAPAFQPMGTELGMEDFLNFGNGAA